MNVAAIAIIIAIFVLMALIRVPGKPPRPRYYSEELKRITREEAEAYNKTYFPDRETAERRYQEYRKHFNDDGTRREQ